MLPTTPLDIAVIALAFVIYYMFAETPESRMFARDFGLLCAFIATFQVYLLTGQPLWAFALWFVQMWFVILLWYLDVLVPIFAALSMKLTRKGK